jgi:hypothetical protein
VLALSHMPFVSWLLYDGSKILKKIPVAGTKIIDLSTGGHIHTFFAESVGTKNVDGLKALITQACWANI